MKLGFWGLALLCLALIVVLVPLHPVIVWAATTVSTTRPATVTIGWGDYVTQLVQVVALVALGFLTLMLKRFATLVPAWFNTALANQLLDRAIQFAVNAVDGAVQGKTLNVTVGNAVAAKALQYANDHGSSWLLKWLGGPVQIAQKIWARLNLEEGATAPDFTQLAATLNAPAVGAKPA